MQKVIVNIAGTDTEVKVADIVTFKEFAVNVVDVLLADGREGRITDSAFYEKWRATHG